VPGKTWRSAAQNPSAPSPVASRGAKAPGLEAAQQLGPGLGRLPVAVGQCHQLLRAVGAHADDHERAQAVLFEAHVEVDAVHPPVDKVDTREVALRPLRVLGLPRFGEPGDRRGRQPGLGAEELAQGGGEVPRREPAQVEDRQHLADLGGLAHRGRQEGRGELFPLAPVVDPRDTHLDGARSRRDRAGPVKPVAHHQPMTGGVQLVGVFLEVGPALGQQRHGQHVLGRQAADLVQAGSRGFFVANRLCGGVMD